jgi:hypothetical protein
MYTCNVKNILNLHVAHYYYYYYYYYFHATRFLVSMARTTSSKAVRIKRPGYTI